jgi:hypothetical protein
VTGIEYELVFEHVTVFLPGLAYENGGVIRNSLFRGCRMEGPAVIITGPGVTFAGTMRLEMPRGHESLLKNHPEAYFWPRPDDSPWSMGGLVFDNCRFEECTFSGVAWAGNEQQRKWWTDSLSLGRWAE